MKRWKIVSVVLAAFAFLLWHPLTRGIVLLILPLGSGVDDLVFFLAVGIAVLVFIVGVLKERYEDEGFWAAVRRKLGSGE